ncbi:hypothetical protein SAMN04487771_100255 [[Clostridium] aminophilum]|uniref:Catalase n=1 Tax=[Clostridium] aminophilum TaxID=1526 RepID=A0A1I0ALZ0_9FIRM|nr:DUF5662 family protein [[Clostridium] aminophilum]SES94367.1 hypothetical protein SAMN04487771_100255 [[Clostridium] aminophilum]
MTIGELFRNGTGHFKTITRHKAEVMKNCFRIGLYWQGLLHDLSKYTPEEFLTGVFYYQGNRSPNAAEKEVRGYSVAWLHHKGRNRHHYEYWIDYGPDRDGIKCTELMGNRMPLRYLLEMMCDRIAASKVYKGSEYTDAAPLQYFEASREIRSKAMHPVTKHQLRVLLRMLSERGEEETFAFARALLRREKKQKAEMRLAQARSFWRMPAKRAGRKPDRSVLRKRSSFASQNSGVDL